MTNSKNLTIALLCVSASVLAAMLILSAGPGTARAGTPSIAGGDYIMLSGAYSDTIDLLYLIDRSEQRMNGYVLNINTGDLALKSSVNLKLAFQMPR